MLPQPNGTGQYVYRSYYHFADFSKTTVAPVTNTITDCTFKGNFYGGGNLGAVGGNVISTLQGHTVVNGSVFGAGFSASIPSFPIHDNSAVDYTYADYAGFIHDGSLDYKKYSTAVGDHAVGDTIYYTWIHNVPDAWNISPAPTTDNATNTFQYPANSGNWYIFTPTSLTGLGTVNGNVILSIEGTTKVEGSVFGGGAQSAVSGNTTVYLSESADITGNVYGGGDQGVVGGSAIVHIQANPPELTTP